MPTTLPNGLTCPDPGDSNAQACAWIKELFVAVDGIQEQLEEEVIETPECQAVPLANWNLQGLPADASCRVYKQTLTVPVGVDATKAGMSVFTASGESVTPCIEVTSSSTICIFTNSPADYTIVYA